MNLKRRDFLKSVGLLMTASAVAPSDAIAQSPSTNVEATLAAFVDVLLPADAMSPSGTDLGVDKAVMADVEHNFIHRNTVEKGCDWLDQVLGKPFVSLPMSLKVRLVTILSESDRSSPLWRFYNFVRYRAVRTYYSHPEALGGLPISGPPQPAGYLPPWGA